MAIRDLLEAYKQTVMNNVTEKTDVNSIDPVDVGDIGTDLADTIVDVLERINQEGISYGTGTPLNANGQDGDRYYQNTGSVVNEFRKTNGIWNLVAVLDVGVEFPDGPLINLRASITDSIVTVSRGAWVINNVIYNKTTQTQLTVDPADLNFLRYDLVYATNTGNILLLKGTASTNPSIPDVPANSCYVDVVVVPASSTGNDPYMLSIGDGGLANKLIFSFVGSDIEGDEENGFYIDLTAKDVPLYPIFAGYINDMPLNLQYYPTNKRIYGFAGIGTTEIIKLSFI